MGGQKYISVLIPDGEENFLLHIVNCLSLAKNLKLFVMSTKKSSPMRYSRFISKYTYYPKSNDIDWALNIDYEVEKHHIDLILPVFEVGFKRLLENQDILKHRDKICSLPNLNNFNVGGNKGLLYLHLEANNLPCPKSTIVKVNELPNIEGVKFPVILKPAEGFGGGVGIESFKNADGLLNYHAVNKPKFDIIIQEFIDGYDMGCNVLCENGDIIAYTIQKGSLYDDGKFTPQIGLDFIKEEAVFNTATQLMKSLNWSGVANIDCRYDQNDGKYKVIEINTRFWLTVEASALAGVNFPYLYCLSSLKKGFSIPKVNLESYLTLKGFTKKVKTNPLFVFKFKYIYNNTSFRFAYRDPLPMVYKFIVRIKNSFVKIFTKKM